MKNAEPLAEYALAADHASGSNIDDDCIAALIRGRPFGQRSTERSMRNITGFDYLVANEPPPQDCDRMLHPEIMADVRSLRIPMKRLKHAFFRLMLIDCMWHLCVWMVDRKVFPIGFHRYSACGQFRRHCGTFKQHMRSSHRCVFTFQSKFVALTRDAKPNQY